MFTALFTQIYTFFSVVFVSLSSYKSAFFPFNLWNSIFMGTFGIKVQTTLRFQLFSILVLSSRVHIHCLNEKWTLALNLPLIGLCMVVLQLFLLSHYFGLKSYSIVSHNIYSLPWLIVWWLAHYESSPPDISWYCCTSDVGSGASAALRSVILNPHQL